MCADECSEFNRWSHVTSDGRRQWNISDDILENNEYDLQKIIICTNPDALILLNTTRTIRPKNRVQIPWNIDIIGFSDSLDAHRATLTCPEGEGLFLIKCERSELILNTSLDFRSSVSFGLQNVNIIDCDLKMANETIISTEKCANNDLKEIKIENVSFVRNTNNNANRSIGLFVYEPWCYNVSFSTVNFTKNEGNGVSAFGIENHLDDVCLENNVFQNKDKTKGIFSFPYQSTTIIDRLIAHRNEGTILSVEGGSMKVKNSKFNGGKTRLGGAAARLLKRSNVTFMDCTFSGNKGSSSGAIYAHNLEKLIFKTCKFSSNQAIGRKGRGGAIGIFAVNRRSIFQILRMNNCDLVRNRASVGGGVYIENWQGRISLFHALFDGNMANLQYPHHDIAGGAIAINRSQLSPGSTIQDSAFKRNSGKRRGGAIAFSFIEGSLQLRRTTFTENKTPFYGGSVISVSAKRYEPKFTLKFDDCTVKDNGTKALGTILVRSSNTFIHLKNSVFANNEAADGAGIYARDIQLLLLHNCIFKDNRAHRNGGAVFMDAETLELTESTFDNNSAKDSGGAILLFPHTLNISSGTFKGKVNSLPMTIYIF